MLHRIFRPVITSQQCIIIFQHIADIKHFSVSTICSKKAFNSRPPSVFFAYRNAIYPRLKEEYPSYTNVEISQAAAQKWNELSETEKEKYKDIYNNNMKEYKADDTVKEIEQLKNEIEELLADRPTHYKNNWSFQMADGLRTTKGNMEAAVMKAAEKEHKLMDEQERKAYQKKFDESRLDLDKWKDKVEKDGRAEIIKNLESSLKERLKSLQFDKPTYVNPAICYYQKNYKSYEGKANGRLAKCMMQWKTLSDAEKEPYYESLNNYNKDMIVWKEKAGKDGRMKVIQLIKKLISQLKM